MIPKILCINSAQHWTELFCTQVKNINIKIYRNLLKFANLTRLVVAKVYNFISKWLECVMAKQALLKFKILFFPFPSRQLNLFLIGF